MFCADCGSTVCGLTPKKCRAKELIRGTEEANEDWFQNELMIRKFAQLWPSVKHGDIDKYTAQSWYDQFGINLWTKGEFAVSLASKKLEHAINTK
jgi:hypothetical protein